MVRQRDQQQDDPVVAAIARLLKAERDGMRQLRHSQEEAQRLLGEARVRAAAIALRVDGCISKLHTAYLQKIQRDIQAMAAADAPQGAGAGHAFEPAALEAVARRVAAKLTGGA